MTHKCIYLSIPSIHDEHFARYRPLMITHVRNVNALTHGTAEYTHAMHRLSEVSDIAYSVGAFVDPLFGTDLGHALSIDWKEALHVHCDADDVLPCSKIRKLLELVDSVPLSDSVIKRAMQFTAGTEYEVGVHVRTKLRELKDLLMTAQGLHEDISVKVLKMNRMKSE